MARTQLAEELRRMTRGEIREGESMAEYTSFRIGGPAEIMVLPKCVDDVKAALELATRWGVPHLVIGAGTNLLVRDAGIRGVTIRLGSGLDRLEALEQVFRVGAGTPLARVLRKAEALGLGGLEFAAGIPGTVGGAVTMNAGAFGGSMSQVVEEALAIDPGGETHVFSREDLNMGYRDSLFRRTDWVCVEVALGLSPWSPEEIRERCRRYLRERKRSQPWGQPSAGSIFKNPEGAPAGWLIETAGGKGLRRGGAQVSTIHANFIVNCGDAKASDALGLMEEVKGMVYRVHGVELEPEIRVVGEG